MKIQGTEVSLTLDKESNPTLLMRGTDHFILRLVEPDTRAVAVHMSEATVRAIEREFEEGRGPDPYKREGRDRWGQLARECRNADNWRERADILLQMAHEELVGRGDDRLRSTWAALVDALRSEVLGRGRSG